MAIRCGSRGVQLPTDDNLTVPHLGWEVRRIMFVVSCLSHSPGRTSAKVIGDEYFYTVYTAGVCDSCGFLCMVQVLEVDTSHWKALLNKSVALIGSERRVEARAALQGAYKLAGAMTYGL